MQPGTHAAALTQTRFPSAQVQLLDTTNPQKLKLLDTLQLPKGAGACRTRATTAVRPCLSFTTFTQQQCTCCGLAAMTRCCLGAAATC